MDNVKDEFKKLYSSENLTDFEIDFMSKQFVKFCTLLVKQYQSQKKIEESEKKDAETSK